MSSNNDGIVTDVRPEQPPNAQFPIEVTDDGIVTDVRPEQPWNALSPMEVTPDGIITAHPDGYESQALQSVPYTAVRL